LSQACSRKHSNGITNIVKFRTMSILLLLCLTSASTALKMHGHTNAVMKGDEGNSLAQMFVINLDRREDKCGCASHELHKSPYLTNRFSAATVANWKERCPEMANSREISKKHHSAKHAGIALVCSNYQIWKAIHNNTESSQFTIVFEDDIVMTKSAFYDEIDAFLKEQSNADWDIVYVDPAKPQGIKGSAKLQMLTGKAWIKGGSHMLIVRTTSASKLMGVAEKEWATMDRFSYNMQKKGVKVGLWSPGIAGQRTRGIAGQRTKDMSELNDYCAASVQQSDIPKAFAKTSHSKEELAFPC